MTTGEREATAALAAAIIQRIGPSRYQLWFDGKTKFTCTDGFLLIGVPNRHYQEWLESKFADAVGAAAGAVAGAPVEIRFVIDPELFQAARKEQQQVEQNSAVSQPKKSQDHPSVPDQSSKNSEPAGAMTDPARQPAGKKRRWHRLEQFVVGVCNRLAHASAVSVVEAPGQNANPLVIHGPVGTGKTHLLEGIYVGFRKADPDRRICFVTAEDFTNRFVQAMRTGKLGAFRKHFRDCEALLIDDLHFLARKRATQEEFLHTFDALLADGKQLVATCDCHPKLAGEFSAELTDRLLGGAAWGLQPPDPQTRLEILRNKSLHSKTPIPEPVLRLIAEQLRGNVRELEGALNSIRHYAQVTGQPIDLALARMALAEVLRHSVRVQTIASVESAVCKVLHLDDRALQSKHKSWAVSHPRMLAMFLARKHTVAAHAEIGQHFGGRNHSTVVAAEKKVRQWLQEDGALTLGERRWRIRDLVDLVERELER